MYVLNIYAFDKDQLCAWTTIRKKCESIPIYTDAYVFNILYIPVHMKNQLIILLTVE